MNAKSLVNSAMSQPAIKRLALPPKDGGLGWAAAAIRTHLGAQVGSVVQEVVLSHTWDFAMKTDDTVTSQAGVEDYDLFGTSTDCLQVYLVDYAEGQLMNKTIAVLRDIISRRTVSAVSYWTVIRRESGLPVVRLTGTPPDGGKAIEYMYWRNDVKLAECPVALDNLLQVALAKRLIKNYQQPFQAALSEAIRAYEQPNVDPNITVMDKTISAQNARRSTMHGWGG